ncbi:MAG: hypothetical protein WCL39_03330 [Armatimonadota bacterium]
MTRMIQALLVAFLMSTGGSAAQKIEKAAGKPDRMLLQWTSQQQMNWDVRINAQGFRFLAVPLAAHDTGEKQKVTVAPEGGSLTVETVTGWSTGAAVVEVERGKTGTLSVEIRDPYVTDRRTTGQFTLADLRQGRVIPVHSKEWPIRNCTLRLSRVPAEVELEARLLKTLGDDRKKNASILLAGIGKAGNKARRMELLLRGAAACSGGCNHGPLKPDGWNLAIATYQKVIDENKGTDTALDAMWAQASCTACWSPLGRGCDKYGVGKGDWKTACKLYEKLYRLSSSPSDKADALRRMAEIQCFVGDDWDAGLRNYRKIAEENPGALAPSTRWTYRTCAPYCGTDHLAWDIYRAIVTNASDNRGVQTMFDDHFGNIKGNPHIDELARLVHGVGRSTRGFRTREKLPGASR